MSQSSNAGNEARTTREESSANKSDAARTVLVNPESDRDAFHRGLGCASKASGPTRSVSLSWAREQGLDACGNCAPDLAREVVTDGGRVVESPADGVDDLAFEYVHDPHDPDAFLVRCTTCGEIDEYSDRADAHSKADTHGLNCSATGVTPVSSKRVATDGGRDPYGCDTPDCDGEKEVVTPDGYVCQSCADQLAAEYEDADPRLLTDGGEPEDRSVDPLDLPSYCNPAVIQTKARSNGQEVTEKVGVANVDVLDSGAARVRQWDGRTKVVPEWRWCTVIYLRTESYDKSPEEAESKYIHAERVVQSDRTHVPVDTTPTREEVTA